MQSNIWKVIWLLLTILEDFREQNTYIHVYLKNEVRLSIIQWGLLGHAKSQGFRFDTHLLMSYVIIFHSKICFELVI